MPWSPGWRLLVTEPLDGATNMAVDEALLRGRIRGSGAPTVRFYGWRPATVSLGYAQPLDDDRGPGALPRAGHRRSCGGPPAAARSSTSRRSAR